MRPKQVRRRKKNQEEHLPEAFLCSRLPLQGDGIRNNICDGELSHFEGRWQNRTLKTNKQDFIKSWTQGFYISKVLQPISLWKLVWRTCGIPAERILGPQLHQHSVWCSTPSQRICWFSLWQLESWKHHLLSPLHICLPFSVLMDHKTSLLANL